MTKVGKNCMKNPKMEDQLGNRHCTLLKTKHFCHILMTSC